MTGSPEDLPGGLTRGPDGAVRCAWVPGLDHDYRVYHDGEWGVPSRDERHLFEMLVLEGAQAGLSWSTILHKRQGYRRAFADFDIPIVAGFDGLDLARLLRDTGIVRNRLKIEAAIANAAAVLELQTAGGSLAGLLWSAVDDRTMDRRPTSLEEIPAQTQESAAMSQGLKRRGFRFVGPTVCYALMQACGLVNDHVVGCAAGDRLRRG